MFAAPCWIRLTKYAASLRQPTGCMCANAAEISAMFSDRLLAIVLTAGLTMSGAAWPKPPAFSTSGAGSGERVVPLPRLPPPDTRMSHVRVSQPIGWPQGMTPQTPTGSLVGSLAARLINPRSLYVLPNRSDEHTSELQSLKRITYAVFCLQTNISTQSRYYVHIQ